MKKTQGYASGSYLSPLNIILNEHYNNKPSRTSCLGEETANIPEWCLYVCFLFFAATSHMLLLVVLTGGNWQKCFVLFCLFVCLLLLLLLLLLLFFFLIYLLPWARAVCVKKNQPNTFREAAWNVDTNKTQNLELLLNAADFSQNSSRLKT